MRGAFIAIFVLAFSLGGCNTTSWEERDPHEGGSMTGTFSPQEAAFVLAPASAAVRGRFYRSLGDGNVLPGKFGTIKLIPDTAYAREHLERLFRGACTTSTGVSIVGLDPRYEQHMRVTRADPEGNFELFGVPDGNYLIYAFRTSENVWFANRGTVTVSGQQNVAVDVAC